MTWAMLAPFIALMVLGAPLLIALLAAGLTGFAWMGDASLLRLAVQQFFSGMDVFTLMAIPFFILAGTLMNHSGLTDRLLTLCRALVGYLRGGSVTSTWQPAWPSPGSTVRRSSRPRHWARSSSRRWKRTALRAPTAPD